MNFESAGNPHFFLSFCRVMRGCIRKEVFAKSKFGQADSPKNAVRQQDETMRFLPMPAKQSKTGILCVPFCHFTKICFFCMLKKNEDNA